MFDRRDRDAEERSLELFLKLEVLGVRIVFETLVAFVVTGATSPPIALLLLFLFAAQDVFGETNLAVVSSSGSDLSGLEHRFELGLLLRDYRLWHRRWGRGRLRLDHRYRGSRRDRLLHGRRRANWLGLGDRIGFDLDLDLGRKWPSALLLHPLGHSLRLDVDAVSRQSSSEAGILPLAPDRETELHVRDCAFGRIGLRVDPNRKDLRRAERVLNEASRVAVPLDHVDALAVQLIDDV